MNTSYALLRLKYKHLYLLKTLHELKNLHLTAQQMNMSQPAATRMLGEIERIFDGQLFTREPRGLSANDTGRVVIEFAINELGRLDRCADEVARVQSGGRGELTIGAIMGAAPDLVAHCVIEMKRSYPLLKVRLAGETSDQVISLLEQGRIDLGICRQLPSSMQNGVVFEPLGFEEMVTVVRSHHPLLDSPLPPLSALLEAWPWILQPPSTPARKMIDRAFEHAGLWPPRDIIESSSMFASLHLVQHSDAILILSESVVRDFLTIGRLSRIDVPINDTLGPFGLVYRSGDTLAPPAQRFARLLRIRAQQLSQCN